MNLAGTKQNTMCISALEKRKSLWYIHGSFCAKALA